MNNNNNICSAITLLGNKCKLKCAKNEIYCHIHIKKQNIMKANNIKKNITKSNLFVKIKNDMLLKNNKILEKQILDKHILKKQIKSCDCCMCEYTNENFIFCSNFSLNNKHSICIECLKRSFNIKIKDKIVDIKCLYCNGEYDYNNIINILDKNVVDNFIELYNIQEVLKLSIIIKNFQICPFCKQWGIENTIFSENPLPIKCYKCKNEWCNKCNKKFHKNSCYSLEYNNKNDKNLNSKIYNIIFEIITDCYTNKCPYCNAKYLKFEGCNLITCTKCKGKSCYLCNFKITKKIETTWYWHFKDNPYNIPSINNIKCLLFNDDKNNLDIKIRNNKNIKIINIFNELIISNIEIKFEIYDIIKSICINNNYNINYKSIKNTHNIKLSFFKKIKKFIKNL